jgi:hypothetical protein
MSTYLPQHDGLLPYFLLLVCEMRISTLLSIDHHYQTSFLATAHSLVCYISPPSVALKQFSGTHHPPHTRLLAHVYGVKNIYTSLIRTYAAYQINNPALYNLATFTYAAVLFLFTTELVVWRTVRLREAVFPFVNAGVGLAWMLSSRERYLVN